MTTVAHVIDALDEGGVVALPTDTVYGLVCRADDAEAMARIFELKGRPRDKTFQILLPAAEMIDDWAVPSEAASTLAGRYWPGALTIVMPAHDDVAADLVRDGTIGLRVPDHPDALLVLASCGALAASSANLAGRPTLTTIADIELAFPSLDAYLDGGPIDGASSTVVDTTGAVPVVLREGVIPSGDVTRALSSGRFEPD